MRESDFQSVISDASRGHTEALTALYTQYHRMLVRYLRPQAAGNEEDLARNAWVAAVAELDDFKGSERDFRRLLLANADRELSRKRRSTHRASSRRSRRVIDLRHPAVEALGAAGVEPVSDAAIAGLLQGLSPHQAHILLLRVVGGLTAEETAELLHDRPATIRLTEHEALQQIAVRLRTEEATAGQEPRRGNRTLSPQAIGP